MSTGRRIATALFALAATSVVISGWALDPRAVEGVEVKRETKEPPKPPESTPPQVPEPQQPPPAQTEPAPTPSEKEKAEQQAKDEAKAKDRAEAEAAAEAEEQGADSRAPKRFIPTTRSKADNSATFPVDI